MLNIIKKIASFFVRLIKTFKLLLMLPNEFLQFLIRPFKISNYIKDNEIRKIQLGSGANRYEGWLNTGSSGYKTVTFLSLYRQI